MKSVAILGITGSIGTTALRGMLPYKDSLKIVACSVNTNVDRALNICKEWNIPNLCITSNIQCPSIDGLKIYRNLELMLKEVQADMVLNGISGSNGLMASVWTLEAKSKLALANKETVVMGGKTFFSFAKQHNGLVIPVDSEHSAIDELIRVHSIENVSKLIITASGGPFRNTPIEQLEKVTSDVAVKHPTWNMGPKISIDSSTLANKGLEVIEAHFLFGFDTERIEVVVHPQSIVHSMVRTTSGQVYAQMSPPDMAFPIMRAILEGQFKVPAGKDLDFSLLDLNFMKLDYNRFPFVQDAFECAKLEGAYPIAFNIADEIAVQAFVEGKIKFTQIRDVVRKTLDLDWSKGVSDINDVPSLANEVASKVRF